MELASLEYMRKEAARREPAIVVYALSTCGFCKKAFRFLDENAFAYDYIHLDLIPLAQKTEIKARLKEKFHESVAFPFAVFNDTTHLVGFIEADWRKVLGL